jgi:hypothetical protein
LLKGEKIIKMDTDPKKSFWFQTIYHVCCGVGGSATNEIDDHGCFQGEFEWSHWSANWWSVSFARCLEVTENAH